MKAKICTLLIAIVALAFVLTSFGCERVSAAGSVSVSSTKQSKAVLRSNSEVSQRQTVTAVADAPRALLSNRIPLITSSLARCTTSHFSFDTRNYEERDLLYHYNFDGRRAKPPAFTGLGGNHFARADV